MRDLVKTKPQVAEKSPRNTNVLPFIGKLLTNINIGGYMSEQGADKYGENISSGIKFFLKAVGIGALIALILWQLPLIQLINAIKS